MIVVDTSVVAYLLPKPCLKRIPPGLHRRCGEANGAMCCVVIYVAAASAVNR